MILARIFPPGQGEQELLADNDDLKKEMKTTTETLLMQTNEGHEDDQSDNENINPEVWRNEKFFDIPGTVTHIWKKNRDDERYEEPIKCSVH